MQSHSDANSPHPSLAYKPRGMYHPVAVFPPVLTASIPGPYKPSPLSHCHLFVPYQTSSAGGDMASQWERTKKAALYDTRHIAQINVQQPYGPPIMAPNCQFYPPPVYNSGSYYQYVNPAPLLMPAQNPQEANSNSSVPYHYDHRIHLPVETQRIMYDAEVLSPPLDSRPAQPGTDCDSDRPVNVVYLETKGLRRAKESFSKSHSNHSSVSTKKRPVSSQESAPNADTKVKRTMKRGSVETSNCSDLQLNSPQSCISELDETTKSRTFMPPPLEPCRSHPAVFSDPFQPFPHPERSTYKKPLSSPLPSTSVSTTTSASASEHSHSFINPKADEQEQIMNPVPSLHSSLMSEGLSNGDVNHEIKSPNDQFFSNAPPSPLATPENGKTSGGSAVSKNFDSHSQYLSLSFSQETKRRTKTGCLTCRRRRVKCDEKKPHCRNCSKSERICFGYDPVFTKIRIQRLKDLVNSTRSHLSIVDNESFEIVNSMQDIVTKFSEYLAKDIDRVLGTTSFHLNSERLLAQIYSSNPISHFASEVETMRQLLMITTPTIECSNFVVIKEELGLEKLKTSDYFSLMSALIESLIPDNPQDPGVIALAGAFAIAPADKETRQPEHPRSMLTAFKRIYYLGKLVHHKQISKMNSTGQVAVNDELASFRESKLEPSIATILKDLETDNNQKLTDAMWDLVDFAFRFRANNDNADLSLFGSNTDQQLKPVIGKMSGYAKDGDSRGAVVLIALHCAGSSEAKQELSSLNLKQGLAQVIVSNFLQW